MLGRVNDHVERVLLGLGVICLIGFVACVMLEVFSRAVLGQSFIWSQDAATILFLWSVFIVAPVAFRHDAHLQITLFAFDAASAAGHLHRLGLSVINLVFAGAYTYLSWLVVTVGLGRVNAATGWPLEIGWASMLVMGVASLLFVAERLMNRTPLGVSARPESPLALDLTRGS